MFLRPLNTTAFKILHLLSILNVINKTITNTLLSITIMKEGLKEKLKHYKGIIFD